MLVNFSTFPHRQYSIKFYCESRQTCRQWSKHCQAQTLVDVYHHRDCVMDYNIAYTYLYSTSSHLLKKCISMVLVGHVCMFTKILYCTTQKLILKHDMCNIKILIKISSYVWLPLLLVLGCKSSEN